MDSSAAKVGSGEINRPAPSTHTKWQSCGFAIALILGIGGLAVGAAGATAYFHVGSLSNISQVNAIIMMSVGGGGAVIFLVLAAKNHPKVRQQNRDPSEAEQPQNNVFVKTASTWGYFDNSIDTRRLYGPQAWSIWNVEILDHIPEPPQDDPSKVLLYIPKRVKVNGQEKNFDLNVLTEVTGGKFAACCINDSIEQQFGKSTGSGRWIEIDMNMDPTTFDQTCETQEEMMKQRGGRLPNILEAIILIKLVCAHTNKPLWGTSIYTRCSDKVSTDYCESAIYVGFGNERQGVYVGNGPFDNGRSACGAACVLG